MPNIFRQILDLFKGDGEASTEVWVEPDGVITDKVLGYFNRQTDKAQIRSAIIRRFGTGIKSTKDAAGNVLETYTREGFQTQVNAGMIEAISIGFGHNVVSALASLFTEDSQKFTLVPPKETTDTTPALDLLTDRREASDYLGSMSEADAMAMQIGSAIVFLEWVDGALKYTPIDPGKVKIRYDSAVESDGVTRPVDYSKIEDATCVIIETGSVDSAGEENSFVAIFGRCVDYPQGRYVTYSSPADGKDVPAPGTRGTMDYVIGGELANPLSVYASDNEELKTPEYPLAILYGGHTKSGLLPVSTSLLTEALDADVAASHARSTSQDAARGTTVISREEKAAGKPLPHHVHGAVDLPPGMSLEHVSHDAPASMSAWTLVKEELIASAMAYGVPDYMAFSEDHTLDASSGIALQIKTRPLVKARQKREKLNRPAVERVFEIEKAYISFFSGGNDAEVKLLESCGMAWDPGEIKLPRNEKEAAETVDMLIASGYYDTIEALREVYQLPSEQEAIDKYEALKKRREKYPPLNAEEKEQEKKDALAAANPPAPPRKAGSLRRKPVDANPRDQQENGK